MERHDLFGTLSTGENSYYPLVSIAATMDKLGFAQTGMFDLWLLNVADILVSLNIEGCSIAGKCKFHAHPCSTMTGPEFRLYYEAVLSSEKLEYLLVDLKMAKEIQANYKRINIDEICSDFTANRIKRLVTDTLFKANLSQASFANEVKNLLSDALIYVDEILDNSPKNREKLNRSVQYDYALGFFEKLASHIVNHTIEEQKVQGDKTCIIYEPDIVGNNLYNRAFNDSFNARSLCRDYITTVCRILVEMAETMPETGYWNFEFEDAGNRLTELKMDKLIGIDGAFKQNQILHEMAKEILFYR